MIMYAIENDIAQIRVHLPRLHCSLCVCPSMCLVFLSPKSDTVFLSLENPHQQQTGVLLYSFLRSSILGITSMSRLSPTLFGIFVADLVHELKFQQCGYLPWTSPAKPTHPWIHYAHLDCRPSLCS